MTGRLLRLAKLPPLDLTFLLLFPWLLWLLNDSWTVTDVALIDPHVYTGYMMDLEKYIKGFGPLYYGSRLPWVLLGSGAYSVLDTIEANLFLRFFLLYAATLSMYAVVRATWHDRALATLAALLIGTNITFLVSIAWDYVDGPATVFFLMALALLAVARTAPSQARLALLFAAGIAGTTSLSIHVFFVIPVGGAMAWYVLLRAKTSWDRQLGGDLLAEVLAFATGLVVAFMLYGLVNHHLGGQLNYLQPQIDFVNGYANEWRPGVDWFHTARWLALPFAAFPFSLFVLGGAVQKFYTIGSWRDYPETAYAAVISCLGLWGYGGFLLFQQVVQDRLVLEYAYFIGPLHVFSIIVIVAGFAQALRERPGWQRGLLIALGAVVLLTPLASLEFNVWTHGLDKFFPAQLVGGVAWPIIVLTAALLAAAVVSRQTPLALLALVAVSSLNVEARSSYFAFENLSQRRDSYHVLAQVNDRLARYDPTTRMRFWYGAEPTSGFYVGIASMHLWGYRTVALTFPSLASSDGKQTAILAPGETITILSAMPDAIEQASASLVDADLSLEVMDKFDAGTPGKRFTVYVTRLREGADSPALAEAAKLAKCPCSLWGPDDVPASLDSGDPSPLELGVSFRTIEDGYIRAVRFYKGPANAGPHTASLWDPAGKLLARAQFAEESGQGWQEVVFDSPVPVKANMSYVASYSALQGHFAVTLQGFQRGQRTAMLSARANRNGVYSLGIGQFPQNALGHNYWVDVVFTRGPND